MLELCLVVAVMFLAVYYINAEQRVTYVCPQCRSRNGEHADGCSWK